MTASSNGTENKNKSDNEPIHIVLSLKVRLLEDRVLVKYFHPSILGLWRKPRRKTAATDLSFRTHVRNLRFLAVLEMTQDDYARSFEIATQSLKS